MESWISNTLKNPEVVDLQILNSKNEISSKPCLASNNKGIMFLIPIKILDPDLINITLLTKSSLLITRNNQQDFPQILLEGELTKNTSKDAWEMMRDNWLNSHEDLTELFNVKELFLPQQNKYTILEFKPNRITAWENFDTDPIKIELEIVY